MWLKSTRLLRMSWSQCVTASSPYLWLITPVCGHMLLYLIAAKCTVFCFIIHEIIVKLNIPIKIMFLKKVQGFNQIRKKVLNLYQNCPPACQMRRQYLKKNSIPTGGTNPLSTIRASVPSPITGILTAHCVKL